MSCTEDNLLALSGLQRLAFCERQCALIHIEQAWQESLALVEEVRKLDCKEGQWKQA